HQRQQRGGVAATRHLQLQHHDRDDYGDHAVAEGLEPILFHGHRSPTPWSGKFPPYQSGDECRDAEDAQEDRKLFRSRIARLSDPDPHVDGRTDQPQRDKELRARYQTWPTAAERVTEQHTSKQQREAAANHNHRLHSIFLPIRPCVPGGGGGLAFFQLLKRATRGSLARRARRRPFITLRSRSTRQPKRSSRGASRQQATRTPIPSVKIPGGCGRRRSSGASHPFDMLREQVVDERLVAQPSPLAFPPHGGKNVRIDANRDQSPGLGAQWRPSYPPHRSEL